MHASRPRSVGATSASGVASKATFGRFVRRARVTSVGAWGLAFLVLAAGSEASTIAAQPIAPPSREDHEPAETTAARNLFYQGVEASRAGAWALAEEKFEQAYALVPRAETLFNLAGARMHVGKLVSAMATYREFLRVATPELRTRWGAEVDEAVHALEGRIARLTIRVRGLEADDDVALDGGVLSHAALEVPIAVDPGAHRVTVTRDDALVAEQRATLGEGASADVGLVVVTQERALVVADPLAVPEDDGVSFFESPWTWIIAGVLVAAIATGIVLALVVEPSYFEGTIPPGRTGVR